MTSGIFAPHQVHNAVPLLEHADFLSDDLLLKVGAILIRAKEHRNWGICRKHRHHELKPKELMVHETNGPRDICRPVEWNPTSKVYPHSWHYTSGDHLTPYEYGTQPQPDIPLPLASELLEVMRTESTVALIPIATSLEGGDKKWVETVSSEDRSMTSDLVPQSRCFPQSETVGWMFFPAGQGAVKAVVIRECKKNPVTGFHKAEYT
ncbi:hypothetical protein KCU81_g10026, partial [Aureobasidium melanogenum]|uniref:Uncharacterized protein n=1 Tax=Aureobasidium melanogenum (strain CBS 110374) TaxID=1043003 RepID=A0A074W4T0_AURM1